MSNSGLIGFPLNAMKQAMHGQQFWTIADAAIRHAWRSTRRRRSTRSTKFTGLPRFEHDVQNIAFDAEEFDARLGTPGLHAVRPRAAYEERETILPPDLWQRYEGASIWRDPAFNKRGVNVGVVGDSAMARSALHPTSEREKVQTPRFGFRP